MGIAGVETFLERNRSCSRRVSIPKLINEDAKNVVVVDGNVLYYNYLFRRFNWICGGVVELVEEIRKFVNTFRNCGIELIFFFDDNIEDDMRQRWIKRRTRNVKYAVETLTRLAQPETSVWHFLGKDGFPNRPIKVKRAIISVVQEMNCELHCLLGNRVTEIVSYVRTRECLAILSQNSHYVFYEYPCRYLSISHLNLNEMKTVEYSRIAFSKCLGLHRNFFPLFAAIIGDNKKLKDRIRQKVKRTTREMVDRNREQGTFVLVVAYINENFRDKPLHEVPNVLAEHFGVNAGTVISDYCDYKRRFIDETHELQNNDPHIHQSEWEKIKSVSINLYRHGRLCAEICLILKKMCYEEHVILEDFVDFPPNGLVYRPLRKQMYGILFHEAPEEIKSQGIEEWCMQENGCPPQFTRVLASDIDTLHPGLLELWDASIVDNRWQLFAGAVSGALDFTILRDLPPYLVVPTALLYYLYREVPNNFNNPVYRFLMRQEIEMFIAVAVTIQTVSAEHLSNIVIERVDLRAVRLIAMFISGCHTIEMLTMICGVDNKDLLSIWNYFDGKLFHYLYEQANGEQQFNWENYCGPERYATFLHVKNIVLPLE